MIVGFSGKKRSGKNTAANYLIGKYLLATQQIDAFDINISGELVYWIGDQCSRIKEGCLDDHTFDGIKQYSFADELKRFCIKCFGLTHDQCYGTEEQKNSLTTIRWSDFSVLIDTVNKRQQDYMTAREILQYFGTNVVRRINTDAWVQATIQTIDNDANAVDYNKVDIAIITDARFPNEIDAITRAGGKVVRLLRNVAGTDGHQSENALDDYPYEKYTLVVDNNSMSISEQNVAIDGFCEEIVNAYK